ncbi:probable indole-3-acetic acid-amido synthetase GH3.1 [Mercurialis annua]|uniref:probable indole-3-acetic acid-amido synthetase GH3.1 n=1 Tax=Mercurialis annua TaxID=3986 RepID=UPI0024AFF970|nr:probable indole-3-acetic acid-amido synthetase GH3.1 [Mercurialis annua]
MEDQQIWSSLGKTRSSSPWKMREDDLVFPMEDEIFSPYPVRVGMNLNVEGLKNTIVNLHNSLSFPSNTPACEKYAKALEFIEEITKNAKSVQENLLAEILKLNKDVEYFKRFKLDRAIDSEIFKSKISIITYEDLKPEIERIANGDRSAILSAHPISEFFTSSGTSSGETKLIPITKQDISRRYTFNRILIPAVMNSWVPGLDKGKALYFYFVKSEIKTPSGLLAQPLTSSLFKTDYYRFDIYNPKIFTSPIESILCPDSFQSMYTQLLCGLLNRHLVLRIGAMFASTLIRTINFLQLHLKELAHDIMSGTLSDRVTDSSIRNYMEKIMKPDPELSEFIRVECSKQNWEGFIPRIWPYAKFLDVIITGGMAQHIPTLDYYSGGLPLTSPIYASSECYFGLNLKPMCKPSEVSYTFMPNMAYFEFLLRDVDSSELTRDSPPTLVDLVDVEVGKEYEVVITTVAGLYRYRVGDILRVTGFHNSAPQFQFIGRKNVLLGIDINEAEMQKAIDYVSNQILCEFKTSVGEYACYADTKTNPGHYVIYWELFIKDESANSPTDKVLSQCCLAVEESLNSVYRQGRFEYFWLGPLEIRVVKNGTFEELMDYVVSKTALPRFVNSAPTIKLLDSRVISTHCSPTSPYWTL